VAIPSVIRILRTEGAGALFLGFPAKVAQLLASHRAVPLNLLHQVLRLGPGGGIMMAAFEVAKGVMQ
jgi:hypothetical protein